MARHDQRKRQHRPLISRLVVLLAWWLLPQRRVAQRVSSIVDADQILVLEKGRIVARGTHGQLLESSTTYREIVASQSSAEEAA